MNDKPDEQGPAEEPESEPLPLGEWTDETRPVRRDFPGPSAPDEPLRVAVKREAMAEIVAHAKESLDAEICGVLVGEVCEDDEGVFVDVQAAIRGTAARQAGTHVTFTHETWDAIHQALEEDYPKLRIVGWYHSHPGFGVQFSDLDRFIIDNFFPAPTQVALVTDPLRGDVALAVKQEGGLRYLSRFWVEGREHTCRVPVEMRAAAGVDSDEESTGIRGKLEAVERRLSQVLRTVDALQESLYRFQVTVVIIVCVAALAVIGIQVYRTLKPSAGLPPISGYVMAQMVVGDKTVTVALPVVREQASSGAAGVLKLPGAGAGSGSTGGSGSSGRAPSGTPPDH